MYIKGCESYFETCSKQHVECRYAAYVGEMRCCLAKSPAHTDICDTTLKMSSPGVTYHLR